MGADAIPCLHFHVSVSIGSQHFTVVCCIAVYISIHSIAQYNGVCRRCTLTVHWLVSNESRMHKYRVEIHSVPLWMNISTQTKEICFYPLCHCLWAVTVRIWMSQRWLVTTIIIIINSATQTPRTKKKKMKKREKIEIRQESSFRWFDIRRRTHNNLFNMEHDDFIFQFEYLSSGVSWHGTAHSSRPRSYTTCTKYSGNDMQIRTPRRHRMQCTTVRSLHCVHSLYL